MPDMDFRGTTTAARAGLLGLALLGVAGAALAATGSASFGIYLQITGSCQVDSTAVFEAGTPPGIACRDGTPHALHVQREAAPSSELRAAAPGGGMLVVTLVF